MPRTERILVPFHLFERTSEPAHPDRLCTPALDGDQLLAVGGLSNEVWGAAASRRALHLDIREIGARCHEISENNLKLELPKNTSVELRVTVCAQVHDVRIARATMGVRVTRTI